MASSPALARPAARSPACRPCTGPLTSSRPAFPSGRRSSLWAGRCGRRMRSRAGACWWRRAQRSPRQRLAQRSSRVCFLCGGRELYLFGGGSELRAPFVWGYTAVPYFWYYFCSTAPSFLGLLGFLSPGYYFRQKHVRLQYDCTGTGSPSQSVPAQESTGTGLCLVEACPYGSYIQKGTPARPLKQQAGTSRCGRCVLLSVRYG